jgi:predicted nuclease of predicted toxin-antitoxin system
VRLLFNENLSARLVALLADVYSGSAHPEHAGLLGAPDGAVWEHAASGGYVLVTKDEDFQRLSVVRGPPPKVVWVRLGNCATADVARLLWLRYDDVARFVAHEDAAFLALG